MKQLALLLGLFLSLHVQADPDREHGYLHLGQAPYMGYASADLKLTNNTQDDIRDIRWKIQGINFSAKDNCPRVLKPTMYCRIRVSYWNQFPGTTSGILTLKTSTKIYEMRLLATGLDDPNRNMPRPPPYPRP